MMKQCLCCDWTGDENELHLHEVSESSEFWGSHAITNFVIEECPECGSEEIDDYYEDEELEDEQPNA